MGSLAPLFLSMGEAFVGCVTLPGQTDLLWLYVSQFHGPTIFANKGDHLNVCYICATSHPGPDML